MHLHAISSPAAVPSAWEARSFTSQPQKGKQFVQVQMTGEGGARTHTQKQCSVSKTPPSSRNSGVCKCLTHQQF